MTSTDLIDDISEARPIKAALWIDEDPDGDDADSYVAEGARSHVRTSYDDVDEVGVTVNHGTNHPAVMLALTGSEAIRLGFSLVATGALAYSDADVELKGLSDRICEALAATDE